MKPFAKVREELEDTPPDEYSPYAYGELPKLLEALDVAVEWLNAINNKNKTVTILDAQIRAEYALAKIKALGDE